jgi:hypothetical protein
MELTKEQIETARETLRREIDLLKRKVDAGATLRVGERRFLLQQLEPADHRIAELRGAMEAVEDLRGKVCSRCKNKLMATTQEIRDAAFQLGYVLE